MKSKRSQVKSILRAQRQRWCVAALVLGVAVATPAYAAVNQFVIGMVASGTAPFSSGSGPGLDASPGDAVVRTNDRFIYRVGYSLAPADTQRVVTLSMGATTLPGNYTGPTLTPKQIAYFSAADLPTGPNGCANIQTTPVPWPAAANATQSGVSADGQHIVCVQASEASGANMDFVARVGGAAPNGTTIAPPTPTFQSAGNPGPFTATPLTGVFGDTTLYGVPTLTVSAAPRWKVKKTVTEGGGLFIPKSGPNGEDGYITGFNLGVYASGSRKGLEALQPNYQLQENFNDPDMPNARLVTWNVDSAGFAKLPMGAGTEPIDQNGCGDWKSQLARLGNFFDNTYYQPNDNGVIASTVSTNVAKGGTCVATSVDTANKTATLQLNGTDFSLTHYPLTRGNPASGTLVNSADPDASTNEWWVASKSILVWVPLSDLTPNVVETLTNNATITGTSVTGQTNPPDTGTADARFLYQTGGSHSKLYSAPSGWAPIPAAQNPVTQCDPNLSGDCWVNQVAPGQLFSSRVGATAQAAGYANGWICEKLDNSRLTFVDMRNVPAANGAVVDPLTGVAVRYLAGSQATAPLTFELGVGAWPTRTSVTDEYVAPVRTSGDQANGTCSDAGATWYPSIDALLAAGRSLAEVSQVRAKYASFPAATGVLMYVPLRANSNYAYSVSEQVGSPATTVNVGAGAPTIGSISPNQSAWMRDGVLAPLRGSDALRIVQTEYVRISKAAQAPHATAGGPVSRGATVTYALTVNLTSSTNVHTAPSVDVWDVIPANMNIVPGSAVFNGAPVAETCWPKGTTPPAPAPFAANAVGAGYQACRWTLTNQPVALAAPGNAAGNLPALTFRAIVDDAAPIGVNLLNTSFADSPDNQLNDAEYRPAAGNAPAGFQCKSGATCSFSNWNLLVSSDSGIVLDKTVSDATVAQNTGFTYSLNYAAIGTTLSATRILDVLPVAGDGRPSTFQGSLRLAGPIGAPVAAAGPPATMADADIVIRYTSNAPANINRDPSHASHNVTGGGANSATSTNWCTVAQFGVGDCPADASASTAFMAFPRAAANGVISAGSRYRLDVPVLANGNAIGDIYQNDFVADSPSLTARRPGSNKVLTTVIGVANPGQSVSGRVYLENSAPPNTSDDGNTVDPGIGGVTVRLVCTAPAYDQTLTTAADGTFQFDNVTSGAVCTLTQTQPAGYANTYNTPGTGGSGQTGNTGTTDSTITLTVPNGGSTGNLFAETLNGPPNADMTSTVVCTPNPAAPGAVVSCTVTCTNHGPADALGAMCTVPNAPTLPGAPTPVCSPSGTVVAGASLNCKVDFTMPTTPGTTVDVQGGTGAQNDRNGGSDPAAGNNPSNTRVSDQPTVPVPTLGWPALALLGAALGALGMRRRRSA